MHALASFFLLGRKATPQSAAPLGGEPPEPLDDATYAAWRTWATGWRDADAPRVPAGRSVSRRHEPSTAAS